MKVLWLIYNRKTYPFHPQEKILSKLTVIFYLFYFVSHLFHFHKPLNNIVIVNRWCVCHCQPTVIFPPKQRYVIFICLMMCCNDWEKCMCYCYIYITITTI